MQGPIAQALALTAAGNAFFAGRDIGRFWPDAKVFAFSKGCEFLVPVEGGGDAFDLVARDPLEWFAAMRTRCVGFRLRTAPMRRGPGQTLPVEERLMVGFVGGGPRWLIEAFDETESEIWEGFTRLGDRNDPDRKIWLHAYIRRNEPVPQSEPSASRTDASADLDRSLTEIEAYARQHGSHFAGLFAQARATLAGGPIAEPLSEFAREAFLNEDAARLLAAIEEAWVFGGMGSWNDVALGDREVYDRLSERLFRSLIAATTSVANATSPPSP